jgi:hypothetical protein
VTHCANYQLNYYVTTLVDRKLHNIHGKVIKECIDDILYNDSAHLNDIEPEPEYYDDDNDNEQIMDDNERGQADHHDEGKADHGYALNTYFFIYSFIYIYSFVFLGITKLDCFEFSIV